jgi:hypothetical protein
MQPSVPSLPSSLFSSGFPINPSHAFYHIIQLDLMFGEEYKFCTPVYVQICISENG